MTPFGPSDGWDLLSPDQQQLIESETEMPAPAAPNRNATSSVKIANTVTLQKDGQGFPTLDEVRAFVDGSKDFDGSTTVKMETWGDQREGRHVKMEVTEGI